VKKSHSKNAICHISLMCTHYVTSYHKTYSGLSVCLCACWTQLWTIWNAVWVVDFGGPRELCIRWEHSLYPQGKKQFWGLSTLKCIKLRKQQTPQYQRAADLPVSQRITVSEWTQRLSHHGVDLEIDRVERINSTRLKIDQLDFSRFWRSTRLSWKSIHSIDSLPTVYRPRSIHFSLRNFSWAAGFHRHVCLSVTTMYCANGY